MIVFDSDAETNKQVARARDALAAFLTERGAIVKIVRVPHGPNGEKLGIDDYLAIGGDLVELVAQHAELWRPSTDGACQRSDCADLRERTIAETRILTNPNIHANRRVPYLLWMRRYWSDATRQRIEPDAGPTPVVDADGWDTVRLKAWGREIGLSGRTLSKAAYELGSLGQFDVEMVKQRGDDGHVESDFRLRPTASGSYLESARSLAVVVQAPSHWGGKPGRSGCAKHPDAELIVRTETRCKDCGDLVGAPTETVVKPRATGRQDDARSDQEPASVAGRHPAPRSYRHALAGGAAAARLHQEQDGRIRVTGEQDDARWIDDQFDRMRATGRNLGPYKFGGSDPPSVTGGQECARSNAELIEPDWLIENVGMPPPSSEPPLRCSTPGCANAPPHRHAARCEPCQGRFRSTPVPTGVAS
jgi:hypothetical protein